MSKKNKSKKNKIKKNKSKKNKIKLSPQEERYKILENYIKSGKISDILPRKYKLFSWLTPIAVNAFNELDDVPNPTIHEMGYPGLNKKKKKKNKRKNKTINKYISNKEIIDIPFSKYKSRGTRASKGSINFHYQSYGNIYKFFSLLDLKIDFKVHDEMIHLLTVKNDVYIYRFPNFILDKPYNIIIINIITDEANHANIVFINNKNLTIEYYEPHGYRKNKDSEISNCKGIYRKKSKLLRSEFKKFYPEYTMLDISEINKKTSFQVKLDPDENTGFCVIWCILFIHYRLLNLNILPSKLLKHIDKIMTTNKLLKYAKHVEDTIKNFNKI